MPGYTFRVLVTSREDRPEEVWRDYHRRADVEKRIAELKYDLADDDFCLHEFFATEAAFCAILMLFNLLAEFQRATRMPGYRQPATLRVQVFLCGAILGRAGHRTGLHLSSAWGGLEHRNALFDSLLTYLFPTSPKLDLKSNSSTGGRVLKTLFRPNFRLQLRNPGSVERALPDLGMLVAWCLLFFAAAYVKFLRYDVR